MTPGLQEKSIRIPVTIITGFLGSGKTTLLNNIIRKHPATRFAIIENEFGEMGIDSELLAGENSTIYEIANGCICCSLNGDFFLSLQNLIERDMEFDHLLVETTGIADPMSVIDLFISHPSLEKHFHVNSVICLTDAASLEDILDLEADARKQIALSDTIILNKIDLVRKKELSQLRKLLAGINPMAEIVETTWAQTNGTPLLDTFAYSHPHVEKTTLSFDNINLSLQDIRKDDPLPGAALNGDSHRHDISAEGFVFRDCFDMEMFNIWMSSFLYFNQNSLYRVKGILNFKNYNKRYIFQAVKGSYIFEEGSSWDESEARYSKIVFIGKYIRRSEIEKNLRKLFRSSGVY